TESPPLIANESEPGPLIVTLGPNVNGVLTVIVAGRGTLKPIVSPGAALAIASRREPGPLSCVLTTVIVLPKTAEALSRTSNAISTQIACDVLADANEAIGALLFCRGFVSLTIGVCEPIQGSCRRLPQTTSMQGNLRPPRVGRSCRRFDDRNYEP